MSCTGSVNRNVEPRPGFAFYSYVAPHRPNQVLDDRQAEACSTQLPGTSFVYAIEALEESRKILGWNAGTGVADVHFHHLSRPTLGASAAKYYLPLSGVYLIALSKRLLTT